MLISYGRPTDVDWSITGGSFVGDPNDLINGQPASGCRIRSGGDSSGQIVITAAFDAIYARCAALLNPASSTESLIPADVLVEFAGKLSNIAVPLGGNALGKRTVLHPNHATRRPSVFSAVQIDTLQVIIHDDKNGSPWITHNGLYDLGEIWFGKGADYGVKQNIKVALEGGLLQRKSHENQNWPWATKAYRSLSLNVTPMSETEAIGPRTDQDDFETLMQAITEDTFVLVPSYLRRNSDGSRHAPPSVINSSTISEQRLGRTFTLGNLDSAIELDWDDNEYLVSPIVFGESPP